MRAIIPPAGHVVAALMIAGALSMGAGGQGRGASQPPDPPRASAVLWGPVFIGGYFYDPYFGPYPWWPPEAYPYHYPVVYDQRAKLRVQVTPHDAAVYVDGFHAGSVDEFDGRLQRLSLTPGGHDVVLFLDGYRTVRQFVYLSPGSTYHLRVPLGRLPPGEHSEPPRLAPALPPPPAGTFSLPSTAGPFAPPTAVPPRVVQAYGTLDLRVEPAGARVRVDGLIWSSSDNGHFVVELPAGRHTLEVDLAGYRPSSGVIDIHAGDATDHHVRLTRVRDQTTGRERALF